MKIDQKTNTNTRSTRLHFTFARKTIFLATTSPLHASQKQTSMSSCQCPQRLRSLQVRSAHHMPPLWVDAAALRRHFRCCHPRDAYHYHYVKRLQTNSAGLTNKCVVQVTLFEQLCSKNHTCETAFELLRSDTPRVV